MPAFKVQNDTGRFKSQNYSAKSEVTNGGRCANDRRVAGVKLSPRQQRALLRLRPSQQTATFYGTSPTHSSDLRGRETPQGWDSWLVGPGKTLGRRKDRGCRPPSPESTLRLPLALFSSLTQPQSRCHTPQHCFYFRYSPLLPSQSPCIDTLYRWLRWINVISVHIYALNAILGGADKLRKASLPLVRGRLLLSSPDELPLSLLPPSHAHAKAGISLFVRSLFPQNASQTSFYQQSRRQTLTWRPKTIFRLILRSICMLVAQRCTNNVQNSWSSPFWLHTVLFLDWGDYFLQITRPHHIRYIWRHIC